MGRRALGNVVSAASAAGGGGVFAEPSVLSAVLVQTPVDGPGTAASAP